ncbi:MAG TPA: LptF/LptG family permease [Fimbriimonadaceae bacterium]|nr:LptF/LptG family permease [Fimbriimonadaceae bacterium]
MRRIDSLIIKELVGPWVFGVAIFTTLIMAGTYLFKLTDYIVSGISIGLIMQFTLLLMPGVMVKTFSMAMLLAALLAFGRLSSDSEVVALRAAGASIGRIMVPVAVFSFLVAGIAFAVNETLVPYAASRGTALKEEIEKRVSGGGEPVFRPVYVEGKLQAMVMAEDFNIRERSLRNVTMTTFTKAGEPNLVLLAAGMKFQSETNWRIVGGARLFTYDGREVIDLSDTWPTQVPVRPPKPEDILASMVRDLDTFSMAQMRERIYQARLNPAFDPAQIANLEYGYYNKIALPLAAMIFALVGAPMGIRNHRTGAAAGFWLSVLIIFSYMTLANLMAVYAQGGKIPSWVASFTPLAIGLVVAAVLIHKRNV